MEELLLFEVVEALKLQRALAKDALGRRPKGKMGEATPFSMHLVHEHTAVVLETILQKCGQEIPK